MMDTDKIREFYDKLQFPGHYTRQSLDYHCPQIRNPFLQLIDQHLVDGKSVVDIGCGSGLITNLMATRYPNSNFTAIDFSNGAKYGESFAIENSITNVNFQQIDFLEWIPQQNFDIVICQGVLHHIPDYISAWKKLKSITSLRGKLIVGLYHPWGKILKKITHINYRSSTLEKDQEYNPWETSFGFHTIKKHMLGFDLVDRYPESPWHILKSPIKHSRNGGLVTYVFQKQV